MCGGRRPLTGCRAVIFDLDGVVTRTARVHAAAWKELFDAYLERRLGDDAEPFTDHDYREYVDGKPRYDGVADFLASRGIELERGDPSDSSDADTVCGLGNRKNGIFRRRLEEDGVEVFDTTVSLIRRLRARGVGTAVVSSSKNCALVLETAGLADLFDERVDGVTSEELGLDGKPAPDIFVEAARRLGVDPGDAAVVEDAEAGVAAGRAGGFGLVIGVDRADHAGDLRESGADIVVRDLEEIDDDDDDDTPQRA